ncbi:bifunctional diaminohydroxyphosphoribosylaminopyrimidine deaminase/5-amino-6-(5-phosphoribosylamino)uracil reductase RibD [Arthrobacter echini]|nr:bifunctional diaminohydroxyphosphoribosylaminopyrimidine deaminase/5-amino-6-(5-phosphoribosylamino)uracil reductase RibD [Arthrobacter echini]
MSATPTGTTPEPSGPEVAAMKRALELAALGVRGANPLVGAVVLSADGRILGEGHHRGAGTPHAEPAALAETLRRGNDPRDSTVVVTLEPCNHTGRTAPCTQVLREAGVRRVVYAVHDVHGVAAGGAQHLREAGIECVGGPGAAAARMLNERWTAALAGRRPFVTAKSAQSLDGRVAAPDGSSRWITGDRAREDGHRLRRLADAVLVGSGTLLADDPRLTARQPDAESVPRGRSALRVVMGMTPVPERAAMRGPGFVQLATRDVGAALNTLYEQGVRHLLVEGGPRITSAFLRAGAVDELFSYVAPLILGDGAPAFPDLGAESLTDGLRWIPDDAGGPRLLEFGADVRLHLRPPGPQGS